MVGKAIDCWVNVAMGELGKPDYLVEVAQNYFKQGEDFFRNYSIDETVALMDELELSAKDLVRASTEQLTHKMVQRARKGRRLNPHVMVKVRNAMSAASEREFTLTELFTYVR